MRRRRKKKSWRKKKHFKRRPQARILVDKAWFWFSRYTRLRDKFICYTCGKNLKKEFWKAHGGHYIDKLLTDLFLYLNEINVHCQCATCNLRKHGHKTRYALHLEKQYGYGVLQRLDRYKGRKWDRGLKVGSEEWLRKKIELYKKKVGKKWVFKKPKVKRRKKRK